MTGRMLEALQKAQNGPLRRVHDHQKGKPPWPAPACSLAALVKHGLLIHSWRLSRKGYRTDEWHITPEGTEALNPPVRILRDAVRRLHVPGGFTRMMQAGEWVERRMPEPEPVSPDDLDAVWFGAAVQRHAIERDKRDAARRVAKAA